MPAGDGTAFEEFGLNPDGTGKGTEAPKLDADGKPIAPDPRDAKIATLEKTVSTMAEQMKSTAPLAEKVKVLDKIYEALGGKAEDPNAGQYKKIFGEFMDVVRVSSPAMYKLLKEVEADPAMLERIRQGQDALAGSRLADLNTSAHNGVMAAAKATFRGATPAELQEIVLPFEKTVTDIINANKSLRERFVAGDHGVAVEIFERLVQPHRSLRVREKQTRTQPSLLPKAPPRGAAATPAGTGKGADDGKGKPDLRTPAGRMAFHRGAVSRYLDKRSGSEE